MLGTSEKKQVYQDILDLMVTAKTILIITHEQPDGDALGSSLAIREFCLQLNTKTAVDNVLIGNNITYNFLPHMNTIKNLEDPSILKEYDLTIALDCGSVDRVSKFDKYIKTSKNTVNIDHHLSNNGYMELNLIDESASATGEIIFDFIKSIKLHKYISKSIATNLYTAILTDTGGFKFVNTNQKSLYVCSELVSFGADPNYIYQHCYENRPYGMVKLHAYCIYNSCITDDKKIIWTILTRQIMEEFSATDDYSEGLVEMLRQIDTVEIAMLFKETKNGNIKVSFRSKGLDVSAVASSFNGGGHKCAAGGTLKGVSINDAVEIVLSKVKTLV